MDEKAFDRLVGRLRAEAPPPAKPALEQDVWRSVRLSEGSGSGISETLLGLLTNGKAALSMFAAVVVFSGVLSVGIVRAQAPAEREVAALDFGSLTHTGGFELHK